MKAGFIGTGSMGSILIESFLRSGALHAEQVTVSNRTPEKALALVERCPGITVAASNEEVVKNSSVVFLCIKPLEFKNVLSEIQNIVDAEQIVVSITSPVLVSQLEELLPCKIAKVIPSITNFAFGGAALCMYGTSMNDDDKEKLEQLLAHISTPVRISEEYARTASDLSSCGPAFLAFFLQNFIDAATEETGIPREQATRLASEMLLGTGKLLTQAGFTPQTLQKRVAVPGGITAEGLRMLADEMNGTFNRLIRTTHGKYAEDLAKVKMMLFSTKVERDAL